MTKPIDPAVAVANLQSAVGGYQPFKGVDGFRNDISNLKERWDNRLVFERMLSLSEPYLDGRLEILVYGDWAVRGNQYVWLCRIAAASAIGKRVCSQTEGSDYLRYGDTGNDKVVLVEVAEIVETPQRFVRSICRPYLFEKRFFGAGEGLLYRRQRSVGFEVFPLRMHWKVGPEVFGWVVKGSDDAARKMIQCRSQIVDRVTNNDCEQLWDWLFGPVGKLKTARLCLNGMRANLVDAKGVPVAAQRVGSEPKFVDVALGPFNL